MQVDVKEWRDFRVGELFDAERGKVGVMRSLDEGDTPVVAAAGYNQGIAGYYDVPAIYKNKLTVSCNGVGCGSVFYHAESFNLNGDALVLLEKFSMTENIGLFIQSVLHSLLTWKYSYAEKLSPDKIKCEVIMLPVMSDGEPDWNYMEQYMQAVMDKQAHVIETLARISKEKHPVDIKLWGGFRIGELFEVTRPIARSDKNYDNGDMPYVASGSMNNGVITYLNPKSDVDYDAGNCITVSPIDGWAFYQKDKFLGRGGAGSSIIILRCNDLTERSGLFISTTIRIACSGWSYSNMGNKDILANTIIMLPVTPDGEPDWTYMDDYMQKVIDRQAYVVSCLEQIYAERH